MKSEEHRMLAAEPLFPLPAVGAATQGSWGFVSLATAWKILAVSVWLWSLFETHWELAGETRTTAIMAILSAKLIFAAIVFGALRESDIARVLFSFCCTVSIIVIAMALPRMYSIAPFYFFLCLIETVLKTAAVIALAFDYVGRDMGADVVERNAFAASAAGEFDIPARFHESAAIDEMRR